jgi:HEAT repeat protein
MIAKLTGRVLSWLAAGLLVGWCPCLLVADEIIDSPMYKSPVLPTPRVETYIKDAKELWLKALARPEAELRCQAADAIARAHRGGLKGLDVAVPPLRAALDQSGQHPTVLLAVARALIALESRNAAPSLFRVSEAGDSDLREVVEPALARWDYRPARAAWLSRLGEPSTAQRGLVLAIRALGQVREGQAAEKLSELVRSDRQPATIRLEAARALGSLRTEGLEKVAEGLARDSSPRGIPARLAAATLLHQHRSAEAVQILQGLGRDPEPTVAARAAARLIEIDPKQAAPALEHLLASPDARLRTLAVEILFREPDERRLRQLADRIDDVDPEVRGKARRSLKELATKKGFRDTVIGDAVRLLAAPSWRGQEQAAVLLAQLDHKPAAGRLFELLKSDRPEVLLTAAWGLRVLEVPETLPDVTRYVEGQQRRLRATALNLGPAYEFVDQQVSQLNQLLGRRKYGPAEAVLRQFIPKMPGLAYPEARAAAIWGLGLIHEGKPEPALVSALEERLKDAPPMKPPESRQVRRMAAISIGRMNAKGAVPSLRLFFTDRKPSLYPLNNACGWAIERLTGELMPAPTTIRLPAGGAWFLSPTQ